MTHYSGECWVSLEPMIDVWTLDSAQPNLRGGRSHYGGGILQDDCFAVPGKAKSHGILWRYISTDNVVQKEPMNQHSSSKLRVTLRLEVQASGRVAASVIEFPDCRVEAATREAAIAEVQATFLDQLARSETLSWDVPLPPDENLNGSERRADSPWIKYAGMFKDDPDFAEIATAIRAEREVNDDTEVDPSVYLLEG
jgi:hypothetical protein